LTLAVCVEFELWLTIFENSEVNSALAILIKKRDEGTAVPENSNSDPSFSVLVENGKLWQVLKPFRELGSDLPVWSAKNKLFCLDDCSFVQRRRLAHKRDG